jgi:hypothetical protein
VKEIVDTVKVGEEEHIVVYCKAIDDVFNWINWLLILYWNLFK